jgi:hypothetical protein
MTISTNPFTAFGLRQPSEISFSKMKNLLSPHWTTLESLIDIAPPETPAKFLHTPKSPKNYGAVFSNIRVPKNWGATRRGSPPPPKTAAASTRERASS